MDTNKSGTHFCHLKNIPLKRHPSNKRASERVGVRLAFSLPYYYIFLLLNASDDDNDSSLFHNFFLVSFVVYLQMTIRGVHGAVVAPIPRLFYYL